jgi:hypothetical protein
MADSSYKHEYQIGDAVLAKLGGAQIPGVIQDEKDGKFQVRLAEPWSDETGRRSDLAWLTADQLEAYLEEETGGKQALPS